MTDDQTETRRLLDGIDLRYVLSAYLLRAPGTLTVADLRQQLDDDGFGVRGRASKIVSDALRWEIGHDRVERRGRGTYRSSRRIPRTTQRRLLRRVQDLRAETHAHRQRALAASMEASLARTRAAHASAGTADAA
jgi:hypothetical protein